VSTPLISIDQARARIRERIAGRLGSEKVPIDRALDRVLATAVRAAGDAPPFPSSAMDGYALPVAGGPAAFALVGESRAGAPFGAPLAPGEAVRISTGAAVPAGTASVIRQEDVTVLPDRIETQVAVDPEANIRHAGEDMLRGALVLEAGTRLGPAQLGAAVAAGAGALTVARRPRVTILCTGDELRSPGETLGPGEIHNSNAPMLSALATHCGATVEVAPTLPDDPAPTQAELREALSHSDVLIVSGGVSVGPHDHVKPALLALGVTEHFWGVALQPGKPTWFGSRGGQLVFALPGNPVSSAVTFALFVRPALDALQGAAPLAAPVPEAELAVPVRRNPGRDQAIRVRLEHGDGRPRVIPTGAQGSHLFSSLLLADALAVIPAGSGTLEAGSRVRLERAPS
jgi:molybdopterin molybdotransferase